MPLNLRATEKNQDFNVSVSYKIGDNQGKLLDARNVNSIQNRLDTRFGYSRYNDTSLGGEIQSVSYFTKSDGSRYMIAKVGSNLYSVPEVGAATSIKNGLELDTVHRGVTGNDRHIVAIGVDGLFSWDGTTFSVLGSIPPLHPTLAAAVSGGNLTTAHKYRVGLTFYASSIGFESNVSGSIADPATFAEITLTAPNLKIQVTDIPPSATNAFVDKVRIYLQDVTDNSAMLFVAEINIGVTSYEITDESLSSQVPPTKNGVPLAGGGKYLSSFNSKLVYAGNDEFPNEVYFSEEDLPDAFDPFDTRLVLPIPGKGGVTGIAVGLFNDTVLDPFLVIFKRKSTRIYSEIGGIAKLVVLSEEIGCVSADTVQVKNGVLYFLSEEGWRGIANGRLLTDKQGDAITLGNGDIDDIFKTPGYVYEVNRNGMAKAFSVYYPTLDQYMTWVSEGTNAAYTKTYVYEFDVGGFKPWEFNHAATCATLGENSSGRDVVYFGTTDGFIMKHSVNEARSDIDSDNNPVAINVFTVMPWLPPSGDFDATFNYRELILKAISSSSPLTVKTFVNYTLSNAESSDMDFTDPSSGFILDESLLDEGVFGDDRTSVTQRIDINRVGESLAIGFYQSAIGSNIGLISLQIDYSKNGNRNIPAIDSEDPVFDEDSGSFFLSPSEYATLCAGYLQQIQALTSGIGNVNFSGFSSRFSEAWSSSGVEDTFSKILLITYTGPLITLSASGSSTVREKGNTVTSTNLTATTTKRSDPIAKVEFYQGATLLSSDDPATYPSGGSLVYAYSTPFSDNISFTAKVTDNGATGGPSTITSNTSSFTFVYPYFSGAGTPSLSAASVTGLTKDVRTSTSSLNKSFTTANGDVYYFAYPASYGALTSIKDENNFETIGDWTLRTENITGLDASAQSYRIYEFNNPVVAGTTDYTFIR